ncbi:MAG: transglutaminase-like domain-containing protein [Verrucomicrobiales bacterium]
MTGHPLIGLVAALLVEAAHWTRIRWDFGDVANRMAWRAAIVLFLFIGTSIWINSSAFSVMSKTFVWTPIILLPVQLVQNYGMRRSMSMTSVSHFLQKRRDHAKKHGLPFRDTHFNFGHTYLVITLIGTSLGEHAHSPLLFPAFLILFCWAFHHRFRLAPIGASIMVSLGIAGGVAGELGLKTLYQRILLGDGGHRHRSANWARETRTSIGSLGEIKQSPEILWRLIPGAGDIPKLLRISAYNSYINTYWGTTLPIEDDSDTPVGDDDMFVELPSITIEETDYRVLARQGDTGFVPSEIAAQPEFPHFTLRGAFQRQGLIPLPSNATSIIQESVLLETNPFGTLRHEPKFPVANAVIRTSDPTTTARPPWPDLRQPQKPDPDLRIPRDEHPAILRLVDQLELRSQPLDEVISRLRRHFDAHFQYTRYLENPRPRGMTERSTFITNFLENSHRGHCEYFATATVFVLRECGFPTRYATGFMVDERDPESGIAYLRGTHAHAWALAWDKRREKWIDVDLTPPDWTAIEAPRISKWQPLLDRIQIIRDDFMVWRANPRNVTIAITLMALPMVAGATFVARRIWRSRKRLEGEVEDRLPHRVLSPTPLNTLEPLLVEHLGPRPAGMPIARWIKGILPSLDNPAPLLQSISRHQQRRFDPQADPDKLDSQLAASVELLRLEISNLSQDPPEPIRSTHKPPHIC